jgi:hypothetical protein
MEKNGECDALATAALVITSTYMITRVKADEFEKSVSLSMVGI